MTAAPEGRRRATPARPVAVAFCPSPPLLLPGVEGRPAPETVALRRAAPRRSAACWPSRPGGRGRRRRTGPRRVPGSAPGDPATCGASASTWSSPFAGPVRPGGRARAAGARPRRLAPRRGRVRGHPARAWVRPTSAPLVRDLPGPLGVLAMGDGSARRTVKAPATSTRRPRLRRRRRRGAGAPGTPPRCRPRPAEGERLLAAGCPPWQAVGAALAGPDVAARLHLRRRAVRRRLPRRDWVAA